MRLFLDSSAFAKRFIEESGSDQVEKICAQATELCLSVLCVPEIASALNRRLREKYLTRQEYSRAKQRLFQDARDAATVELSPDLVWLSIEILENSPVRTLDAIQIASAIACEADLFVSADRRQIAAAKAARLKTKFV